MIDANGPTAPSASQAPCPVCGADAGRTLNPVLWPELVAAWELSPQEAALVDRREGESCDECRASMRSQALASAILQFVGFAGSLASWCESQPLVRLLEVNAAGTLTPWLSQLPCHALVAYPEVDMHHMPFEDGTWDILVHSETVEHVADPVGAMAECRRLLAPGGAVCFTAPVVPGRLTRRRDQLAPSFHGLESDPAYLVVSEFGADFWTQVLDAGYSSLTTVAASWPVSVAYIANR